MPLSRNLGALTSWNTLGLSRPVMGLLYLFTCIIHLEFVPVGTTVKSHYYFVMLKRLYVDMYRVRKEQFRNNRGCSCMIRCPLTWPLNVKPFLASKSICMIQDPIYLPDLSPGNFPLSEGERVLKGRRLSDISDIQLDVTELLKGIELQDFQRTFEDLCKRSQCCVELVRSD